MKTGTDRSLPPEHGERTERYYCRWCEWYVDTQPRRMVGDVRDFLYTHEPVVAKWEGDSPEAIDAAIEAHLIEVHPEALEAIEKQEPLPPTTFELPPRWVAG